MPAFGRVFLSLNFNIFIMLQVNVKPVLLGVLGTQEIIIILIIVLLLFGGRKIPELMRGLGRGVREFNDAKSSVRKEIEEGMNDRDRPAAPSATTSTNNTTATTTTTTPQS